MKASRHSARGRRIDPISHVKINEILELVQYEGVAGAMDRLKVLGISEPDCTRLLLKRKVRR